MLNLDMIPIGLSRYKTVIKLPLILTDHMIFSIMTFKRVKIRHEKLFESTKKSKLLNYLRESFNVKNG